MRTDDEPLEVIFLGFALPEERFARVLDSDPGMPVQTQRFGWAVIDALRSAGANVRTVSTDPVTDYPNNPQRLFRSSKTRERETEIHVMPFVNVTVAKHITRWAASLHLLHRLHMSRRADFVMVHGVNSALLWAACLFGRLRGVPVVVILTDPPSLRTAFDSWLTWQLKQVDRWTITSALGCASGVVALAPRLATDFAPGVPALMMEGISTEPLSGLGFGSNLSPSEPAPGAAPLVVYAGGVDRAYGVLDLVEAVGKSRGTWQVLICGRGPDEAALESAIASQPRARYGGMVKPGDLGRVYAEADLLINPRPIDGPMPRYSFPSKMLEYMASGTPVMSTWLPALPEDYAPHISVTSQGADGLADSIDMFFDRSQAARARQGAAAQEFIATTRGTTAQGERLLAFLREVAIEGRGGRRR